MDWLQRVTVTALPSDRYYITQKDARTPTRQRYFSAFPKSRQGQGLQFGRLLWSRKSTLSNYTLLPRDDIKMIIVPRMIDLPFSCCCSFPGINLIDSRELDSREMEAVFHNDVNKPGRNLGNSQRDT